MSEGNIVLRVVNEGSDKVSKRYREMVIEVKGTQTRAIFGDAVSIEFILSLVS
jgi:hypothetical protein